MTQPTDCKREEFIENNIGLAHSCANRFKGRGIEYDDLFQAACFGLVKAYDAFDADRGVMFSTYAVPVILGEVKQLFRDGGTVKVSRALKDIARKANAERERIISSGGEEPSVTELAQMVGCGVEMLTEAICAARAPISLTVSDDEGVRELEISVMAEDERVAELLSLKDAVEKLEETEKTILFERYLKNSTQSRTASLLNTTQVQISRKEKRIIEKLKVLLK
ncbi:MAG: sigma-70 family RNA polymerase sigma factor [Ruminococcaceae bacterium]|nr:sigma-70 family RNA polymerase sigma factor [Oscillospiraceae bacterium]